MFARRFLGATRCLSTTSATSSLRSFALTSGWRATRSTPSMGSQSRLAAVSAVSATSSSSSSGRTLQGSSAGLALGALLGAATFGAVNWDETPAQAAATENPIRRRGDIEKHRALREEKFQHMRLFTGRANVPLAREVAQELGVNLSPVSIKNFADGEIGIQVEENVRGTDVYIIQPTCPPGVNTNLMELVLLVSTMRRASARTITAVMPYYGYARQDRKLASRVPISAADVARLLEAMGVDRVVAVDLHCGQIQGFFSPSTPCDNLEAYRVALRHFRELGLNGEEAVVVSPDAGGVHRAKKFRDAMAQAGVDASLAMIIKQRLRANEVSRMDLVGSVDGKDVIIVDDMIDTAGTLTKAANELKARGAKRVYAFATHGLFSGPAVHRIKKSALESVVVCNTVPLPPNKQIDKIKQLSIAPVLAQAIERIQMNKSVSGLFQIDQ